MSTPEPESVPCVEHHNSRAQPRVTLRQFLGAWWYLLVGKYWGKEYWARVDEQDTWSEITSYQQACEQTALYLLEFRKWWPSYDGEPNEETREIARELAHANRAGLLTSCSQPGFDLDEGWEQRAAVAGFCDNGVRVQLEQLFRDEPAVTLLFFRTADTRRINYDRAVVVTERHGQPHTSFGAHLPQKQIDFDFTGIDPDLVDYISALWQVTIIDTRWGDHRLIWDKLLQLEVPV